MAESKSARLYLERAGVIRTTRGPVPLFAPGMNRIHAVPLQPPLPLPHLIQASQGNAPDRHPAQIWPHASNGET